MINLKKLTVGRDFPWINFIDDSKNLKGTWDKHHVNFIDDSKNLKGGFCIMNKKGISAIVATVLIILITVAAVTIIWAAIIPMINNQLDKGIVCLDAVQQVTIKEGGYTCIKNDTAITVQIKHGSGDIDLADIQVVVSSNGSSDSYNLIGGGYAASLPSANEERTFVVDGLTSALSDVESVGIAPIINVGNTQESCDVSATVSLSAC